MSEYTKGPWWMGIETDTGEVEVVSDDRPYICMVLPGAIDGRTISNARLIAAAPELLAVCDSYSLPLGGDYKRDCFEFGQMEVDRELARRAAIAKATGEQT